MEGIYESYLSLHMTRGCRRLHILGTGWGLAFVPSGIAGIIGGDLGLGLALIAAGLVGAYGMAWTGHLAFERNPPGSFCWSSVPIWARMPLALFCDLRLFAETSRDWIVARWQGWRL